MERRKQFSISFETHLPEEQMLVKPPIDEEEFLASDEDSDFITAEESYDLPPYEEPAPGEGP